MTSRFLILGSAQVRIPDALVDVLLAVWALESGLALTCIVAIVLVVQADAVRVTRVYRETETDPFAAVLAAVIFRTIAVVA